MTKEQGNLPPKGASVYKYLPPKGASVYKYIYVCHVHDIHTSYSKQT